MGFRAYRPPKTPFLFRKTSTLQNTTQETTYSDFCPYFANGGRPPKPPLVCSARAPLNKSGCARNFVFPYLSNLRHFILIIQYNKMHLLIFFHFSQRAGCGTPNSLPFCRGSTQLESLFFSSDSRSYKPCIYTQRPGLRVLTIAHVYHMTKQGGASLQPHCFFKFSFASTYMVLYVWRS